ncbi:2-deoxy-D-gluconate 3-dehydrogenase [Paenibacillus swuensis]|uniref:2-deoxy-D-gluconate 3-dehydrogenase n=1 Tax=Paenibacillus swuensis TaxID=1178515 RepID=A0A172TFG9_9BACL|nr:glucose 1-dehydrogenase [Paenibacillus swuensis]ANE45627.1 2-deoxy-D-gluconate 3-dehydrogenase [Paenibacillus swuensis]
MTLLPSFTLQGQTALITGAGRGIGQAIAIGYAEAGADVALLARTPHQMEETAAAIRDLGRQAYIIEADLRDQAATQKAVDDLLQTVGRVDILVNNAGMNIRSKALDVTDNEWETIMQTNLKSAFFLSQQVGKHMKEHGGGRIVNISSVGGHTALRTGVVYASTKAAMIQMTKVLSLEWATFGIRVNAIGPWYFRTPLTEKILADPQYLGEILARTPMNRVGELQELVGPAVFLASDASSYMTGQTLFVDGGMTIYGF